MSKIGLGVITNIGLDLMPIALVISNIFARGTDRDDPPQLLYLTHRLSELR